MMWAIAKMEIYVNIYTLKKYVKSPFALITNVKSDTPDIANFISKEDTANLGSTVNLNT